MVRPVKCVKLENIRIEDKPVFFDGEFVRVGAGAVGVPLHEFVDRLATSEDVRAGRLVIAYFVQTLIGHGFAEQAGALFCGRHVERPTLQQMSDVNRVDVKYQGLEADEDRKRLHARLNTLLRAGLLRLNATGAIVIATKPNQ
jgi:hypothetical protein